MTKLLIELMSKIQMYYPIGIPIMHNEFPGTKLIEEKIAHKINNIDNKNTNWAKFIKELKKATKEFDLHDYAYIQFPSYQCSIALKEETNDQNIFNRDIIINISMLTNHYTIYFQDYYRMNRYDSKLAGNTVIKHQIVFMKIEKNEAYVKIIENVKALVAKHFPDFTFLEHDFIFNTAVYGGYPRNRNTRFLTNITERYSVFEYLFDDSFIKEILRVLP